MEGGTAEEAYKLRPGIKLVVRGTLSLDAYLQIT
jgi:hypothetical protein